MNSLFLLNPEIAYLNHGSFGACPKPIFQDFQKWQLELESEPVQFILKNSLEYLKHSKVEFGKFINCDPEDFFYTVNPTVAVNTIMRSLNLSEGDEILATDHEYGAMDKTWAFYCKKSGARYIRQKISLPIVSKEQMLSDFWSGLSPRTKIIFINQISSATALIFPVKEICDRAKELGIITIVDGAHVPGHIDLDIKDLDPDFYTGTLHKWMLTPKGSSFLYVKKKFQKTLDPLVVSWGYGNEDSANSQFLDYHELQGTRDISVFLTTPAAIEFRKQHDWKNETDKCRNLILKHYESFCELLNTNPISPVSKEFLGQMCSIPIIAHDPAALKELLFNTYKIEIPVMVIDEKVYLRISLQPYNTIDDLDRLRDALIKIKNTTSLLQG